jgi:5-methyltetrahydropteroyltriglutamate--homocysteine methyltransferase
VNLTEGRLAVKIAPSRHLLISFIDLNNLPFSRFSPEERMRIGAHTCLGNDLDSTPSADVDYAELLPSLFELNAGNFYIALASEPNRRHALKIIRKCRKLDRRISSESQSTPIMRRQKKCATVRSNPTRIGAGARGIVNF